MTRRLLVLLVLALVAGAAGVSTPSFSAAMFTSSSTATAQVSAAADWTPPSVAVLDPGSPVRGAVTVVVEAADTEFGIREVEVEVRPEGAATWTRVCTDASAPHSCTVDTTSSPDGTYEVRARATDRAGLVATSAPVRITLVKDDIPPRGLDVQADNGPGRSGELDPGDVVTLTWSEVVDLGSVTGQWAGEPVAVQVHVQDDRLLDRGRDAVTIVVQRVGGSVNLGDIRLGEDYIRKNGAATVEATMTARTVTVDGAESTEITITLGEASSGENRLRRVNGSSDMVWTPSAAVTDRGGLPASTNRVTERGPSDRDF